MEKTIKRGINHPLEKLKKLFSTKVIWCAVVLYVLISILSGVGVELVLDKELLSKVYSFGQSYPLIAKSISACLKMIPYCVFPVIFYLLLAAQFKMDALFYDEENGYFEKIKLLLYFKTTWIIAFTLALSQVALFLTVQDRINGLWIIYFLITSLVLGLFTTNLPLVTFFGELFFIFKIKKYWKEIKSFYFLPCLYPIAEIVYYFACYIITTVYYKSFSTDFSGKTAIYIFSYRFMLLLSIFIIGEITVGILWLDYKRSAKNILQK